MTWLVKLGLGAAALVVGAVIIAYVAGLGPFNHRPSLAAKALPKVEKTVAKVQTAEIKAVEKAEVKTTAKAAVIKKRIATHVAKIQAAPAGAPVSDADLFDSLCASQLYAGDPACHGGGGRP